MRSLIFAAALCLAPPASAQGGPYDPATRIADQREALARLAFMDGEWRGPAKTDDGHQLTQTERVGPLLDGAIKLVEGRGYEADGRTSFNAFAVISYDPVARRYSLRSYAMGYSGDFPLEVRPDGFTWETPAGPGARIRYTATIKDDEWHEVGERIAGDAAPVKTFEMRLNRIGASPWPAGKAVAPR